jgi:hypothetical protein
MRDDDIAPSDEADLGQGRVAGKICSNDADDVLRRIRRPASPVAALAL